MNKNQCQVMGFFPAMFISAHDVIDYKIPYPVLPIYLEYSMLLNASTPQWKQCTEQI